MRGIREVREDLLAVVRRRKTLPINSDKRVINCKYDIVDLNNFHVFRFEINSTEKILNITHINASDCAERDRYAPLSVSEDFIITPENRRDAKRYADIFDTYIDGMLKMEIEKAKKSEYLPSILKDCSRKKSKREDVDFVAGVEETEELPRKVRIESDVKINHISRTGKRPAPEVGHGNREALRKRGVISRESSTDSARVNSNIMRLRNAYITAFGEEDKCLDVNLPNSSAILKYDKYTIGYSLREVAQGIHTAGVHLDDRSTVYLDNKSLYKIWQRDFYLIKYGNRGGECQRLFITEQGDIFLKSGENVTHANLFGLNVIAGKILDMHADKLKDAQAKIAR